VRGNSGQRTANVPCNLSRFRGWAKRLMEAISATQRTEITVQTDRVVIIRRRRSQRVWCQQCGCEVEAVSLSEAGSLAGEGRPVLPSNAESKTWHICMGNDGEQLICLESLLKSGK
jgi:hypothetical protein